MLKQMYTGGNRYVQCRFVWKNICKLQMGPGCSHGCCWRDTLINESKYRMLLRLYPHVLQTGTLLASAFSMALLSSSRRPNPVCKQCWPSLKRA